MTARSAGTAAVTLAAAVMLAACAVPRHMAGGATPKGTGPSHPASSYQMPSPPAYRAADLRFVQRLYVYRVEALDLAGMAMRHNRAGSVHALASGIKTVQQGQADELAGWLGQWGKPLPKVTENGWRPAITAAQVTALGRLTGPEFGRQFARLLIAEERGALALSTTEQERGGFGPARQLAASVVASSTLLLRDLRSMAQPQPGT